MAKDEVLADFSRWCEHERERSLCMLRQYEAGALQLRVVEPGAILKDISGEAIANHKRIIKEMDELLERARGAGFSS